MLKYIIYCRFQDDPNAHDNFLRINRAYEVLKDDDLRKKYDMHGEEGLKENNPTGRGYRSWNFYKQEFGRDAQPIFCETIRYKRM